MPHEAHGTCHMFIRGQTLFSKMDNLIKNKLAVTRSQATQNSPRLPPRNKIFETGFIVESNVGGKAINTKLHIEPQNLFAVSSQCKWSISDTELINLLFAVYFGTFTKV